MLFAHSDDDQEFTAEEAVIDVTGEGGYGSQLETDLASALDGHVP